MSIANDKEQRILNEIVLSGKFLDKEQRTPADFEKYSYPFTDLGYRFDTLINPHLYTKKQWQEVSFSPFVKNVEHDKIVLI